MTAISLKSICSEAAAIKREIRGPYDRQSVIKRCSKLDRDRKSLLVETKEALILLREIFMHLQLDAFKERILRVSLLSKDQENHPLFKKALDVCTALERDLETNKGKFDPQDLKAFHSIKVKGKAFFVQMHNLVAKRTSTTTRMKSLARRLGLGVLAGLATRLLGWNYPTTLLAAGIGAIAGWRWSTPKPCSVLQGSLSEQRKGSLEIQALNLLGEFLYDTVMTPSRIDTAQREKVFLDDGFLKLGSTTTVPHSQEAFCSFLKKMGKGEGVVITDVKKTKAFSIGIETDAKGRAILVLFDPASSSCFYCKDINDAAAKAFILTNGMAECLFRQGTIDQPTNIITGEPIDSRYRIKIGRKVQHIRDEMVHLVTLNDQKSLLGQIYTKEDLRELFKKACTYFSPANTRKPLTIQQIARVFLEDNIPLSKNEDEALSTLVDTLTLPKAAKQGKCNSERVRKERFRALIEPSNKLTKEDLDSLTTAPNVAPVQVQLPRRQYRVGEREVFLLIDGHELPNFGIWTFYRGTLFNVHLFYEGDSPSRYIIFRGDTVARRGSEAYRLGGNVLVYPGDKVEFPEGTRPTSGVWARPRERWYYIRPSRRFILQPR